MAKLVLVMGAAVLVHAVFFVAIFDIYFTSQVESGMTPQLYSLPPPARRLVLFVADGLRADTVFSQDNSETSRSHAPYIRRVIEGVGHWGVSHTHVPTESRPGHVALVAGLYEDVSAVTRGWTENPVEFDSLFNRSSHTWAWGSPDILPMFARGAVEGRMDAATYDPHLEDFGDSDASRVDTWVFEKTEALFQRAKVDAALSEMLHKDRVVFFLHLLGIDTNGHTHKPHSKEVLENLKLVDKGVERIVELIDGYYGDGKTAYVFTSDHGMTDWGSHGAGLPDETMTPLVAWGAGIKQPKSPSDVWVYHDGYSEKWGLEPFERIDVEQADIAPLMATLIGAAIPINSEGVLPLSYIHYNKGFAAESIFANCRQLLEQVRVKRERRARHSLPLMFFPFPKLPLSEQQEWRRRIEALLDQKKYQHAIDLCRTLIDLCREGLRYYHTYHRLSLQLAMVVSYLGWMVCVLCTALQQEGSGGNYNAVRDGFPGRHRNGTQRFWIVTALAMLGVSLLLWLQSAQWLHYCYFNLPVVLWSVAWSQQEVLLLSVRQCSRIPAPVAFKSAVIFTAVVTGVQLLVAGFFYREVFSVLLCVLSLWPYLTKLLHRQPSCCVAWTLLCLAMAVFPLLPAIGRQVNYFFVSASGLALTVFCVYVLTRYASVVFFSNSHGEFVSTAILFKLQVCLLFVSSILPIVVNWYLSLKETIPSLLHSVSWSILLFSLVVPFCGPRNYCGRLLHIFVSFQTVYLLLSTSFEAVFVLILAAVLFVWLWSECQICVNNTTLGDSLLSMEMSFNPPKVVTLLPSEVRPHEEGSGVSPSLEDLRRAIFCLLFGLLSFFGVGNIASLNTFDPTSVYCFVTVFSPFTMGGLILLKMALPFLLVACVYNSLLSLLRRSLGNSLLLMLLMTDWMGLNFFFLVRDSGSWLEIGVSISHYIIMMSMVLAVVLLMGVARMLTGVTAVVHKEFVQ